MKIPALFQHIFNPDSRKCGFGWWVFLAATWLLYYAKIDGSMWQFCVMLSAALVGGGTVADKWLEAKNGKLMDSVEAPGNDTTPGSISIIPGPKS